MSGSFDATDQVIAWILSDGDYRYAAEGVARGLGADSLARYLADVIEGAPRWSAPWHLRQRLSDWDMAFIEWKHVRTALVQSSKGHER